MKATFCRDLILCVLILAAPIPSRAWDYEGHRLINQLALDSLPANFLASPAPRRRASGLASLAEKLIDGATRPTLNSGTATVRIIFDLDLLEPYQLDLARVSPFRYEFAAQLALARAAHPQNFPAIDPLKDGDRTKSLIGFLPWTITEFQGKLKSAFSYLKEYETAGTPEEAANARENTIYLMGVMGHFVGDGSQPLHTTKHHHGWVGENPKGYSTNYSIHSWIDGGYLQQFGFNADKLRAQLRPARSLTSANAGAAHELFSSGDVLSGGATPGGGAVVSPGEGRQAFRSAGTIAGRPRLHYGATLAGIADAWRLVAHRLAAGAA